MRKFKLFRGLALINFITLFTVFLLYRNGALDNLVTPPQESYFLSPNGGVETGIKNDSTNIIPDSLQFHRSTHSTPPATLNNLFPGGIRLNPDLDSTYISKHKYPERTYNMMSSSKSGTIFQSKATTPSQKKKRKKRE